MSQPGNRFTTARHDGVTANPGLCRQRTCAGTVSPVTWFFVEPHGSPAAAAAAAVAAAAAAAPAVSGGGDAAGAGAGAGAGCASTEDGVPMRLATEPLVTRDDAGYRWAAATVLLSSLTGEGRQGQEGQERVWESVWESAES